MKISVYVSEEPNEDFYFHLGRDFLSSYSIKEEMKDGTAEYNLRQEIEIEAEEIPYGEQKKFKVHYKHINEKSKTDFKEDGEKERYAILDPSKKYSIISSTRLEKDEKGEIIKKLPIKSN